MFARVYQITQLLDNRMGYVRDARVHGLGDAEYFADMERLLRKGLNSLQKNSCNQRLIDKYTKLINELF